MKNLLGLFLPDDLYLTSIYAISCDLYFILSDDKYWK